MTLELLYDMHWTQQFLCILSRGGACVNANVRLYPERFQEKLTYKTKQL